MKHRIVYKYKLTNGVNVLPLGKILLVAQQNNDELPTIWIEHVGPPNKPRLTNYYIAATGSIIMNRGDHEHVGSAICGEHVWHVYRDIPQ